MRGVREMGAYAVLREVHVGVEDEGVRESVERVVQLLMGDEVENDKGRMDVGEGESGLQTRERGLRRGGGERGMEETDDEDEKIVEIF